MADDNNVLLANVRTSTGKGPARRARLAGLIPAVMYGRGFDPVHLDLPGHDTFLIIKDGANAVINVKYDGKEQLTLVKNVQVHPVSRATLHIDLLAISKDDKVEVEVPIVLVGELAPGNQYTQEEFALPVLAPVTAIPESIEVSIEGLSDGVVVRVGDLTLPENIELDIPVTRDVVTVSAMAVQEEPEAAETEAGSEPAAEDKE